MKTIKTLKQLKQLASERNGVECFISLFGGNARSSKQIWYNNGDWSMFSSICGCCENFTDKEFKKLTNIEKAIEKGALICY